MYETMFLITFLFIGSIFFFIGFEAINSLIKNHVRVVLDQIDKKNQEYLDKLLDINFNEDPSKNIQDTEYISNMLDVLQKQRDVIAKNNTNIYNLKSIVSFIGAFFLPIFADIAKESLVSGDFINQGISILSSLVHK